MSQQNISLLALTLLSAGAVGANRFVTPLGAQTGADGNAIGVTRNAAAGAGEKMTVDVQGTVAIQVGAAVAKGATVKSDANGKAITWVTSGARLAIALEAATAADQVIEFLLIPNAA